LRFNAIHHTMRLVRAPKAGIQHVNHQSKATTTCWVLLFPERASRTDRVRPGRHPTSGARFLYFRGPDGMIFEYPSASMKSRTKPPTGRAVRFEPTSFCMWVQSRRHDPAGQLDKSKLRQERLATIRAFATAARNMADRNRDECSNTPSTSAPIVTICNGIAQKVADHAHVAGLR